MDYGYEYTFSSFRFPYFSFSFYLLDFRVRFFFLLFFFIFIFFSFFLFSGRILSCLDWLVGFDLAFTFGLCLVMRCLCDVVRLRSVQLLIHYWHVTCTDLFLSTYPLLED